MRRITLISFVCLAIGCGPQFRPLNAPGTKTLTTHDVRSFRVTRPGSDGEFVTVEAVKFSSPQEITRGPCQFEDGTMADDCLTWPSDQGQRQIELKNDWHVNIILATHSEVISEP